MIAKSFARIFYRNALNIGLPIFESAEAVDGIESGDEIELEPAIGHRSATSPRAKATARPSFRRSCAR